MSNKTIIFAHRGASGYEYENTIASFEKAIELGADGLETDCWLLKDGHVVLHHDKRLEDNNISKMTLEEVKRITLPNGETVPTLEEFLEKFSKRTNQKGEPLLFSIDLQDLKVGTKIPEILEKYGVIDRTFLCGGSLLHLKKVRKVSEKARLVASNILNLISEESLGKGSKVEALKIEAFNIKAEDFEPSMKELLNKFGYKVFIWDLHTEEMLKKYSKYTPFAIYSNYPDLARKIIDNSS